MGFNLKSYWSNKEIIVETYNAILFDYRYMFDNTTLRQKYHCIIWHLLTMVNNLHARNLNIKGFFGWGNWSEWYMTRFTYHLDIWENWD